MEILLKYDVIVFRAINGLSNQALDLLFLFLSNVAEFGAVWIILAVILLIFGDKETKKIALIGVLAMGLADLVVGQFFKDIWYKPRPYLALPDVHQLGPDRVSSTFPSGHAANSFAGAFVLGKAKFVLGKANKKFSLVLIILAVLIAISRIYLGMHYPSDVMAAPASTSDG